MVCKKCKAELEENATVCKECGTPVENNIEVLDLNEQEVKEENTKESFKEEEPSRFSLDFEEEDPPKKDNKGAGIFTGLVIGLMFAVIAVIGVFFFMKKQMENKIDGEGGGSVVEESQRVTFAGYSFTVPKNVQYLLTSDTLYLSNEESTWTAQVGKKTFDYNLLAKNLPQMKTNAIGLGFTVKNNKETKIGNDSYITMELSANGGNYLAAYTKASNNEVFYIVIYTTTNSYDYKSLKTVASVLRTSKVNAYHMTPSSVNASMVGAITG